MTGEDISQLQAYLIVEGVYPEALITGYFGPATQRAVRAFQAKYGLTQVGRVGPATRAKLTELFASTSGTPAPTPTPTTPSAAPVSAQFTRGLSFGSEGSDVSALQGFLAQDPAIYPDGRVTGYFGSLTQAAVGRFQEKYGIAQAGDPGYGTVGPKTRAKLNELLGGSTASPAPTPVPAPQAMSADDAAKAQALQAQLQALQAQLQALQGL